MNYTRPNDIGYEDKFEDYLNGTLIFAKALSYMLREGQGIVLDIKGDMKCPGDPCSKKVLVYHLNSMIYIEPTDRDLNEGEMINVLDFNTN